jgi:hypothetical protein
VPAKLKQRSCWDWVSNWVSTEMNLLTMKKDFFCSKMLLLQIEKKNYNDNEELVKKVQVLLIESVYKS